MLHAPEHDQRQSDKAVALLILTLKKQSSENKFLPTGKNRPLHRQEEIKVKT